MSYADTIQLAKNHIANDGYVVPGDTSIAKALLFAEAMLKQAEILIRINAKTQGAQIWLADRQAMKD